MSKLIVKLKLPIKPKPSIKSENPDIKMDDSITPPPMEPFPFMKLCPEIRNMVYEELLVMPGMVGIEYRFIDHRVQIVEFVHSSEASKTKLDINQKSTRALLGTSKAIYEEASHFYFRSNHFYFEDVDLLEVFVQKMRPDFRRLIRRVTVNYSGRAPARAMRSLATCIGLLELTLKFSFDTYLCIRAPYTFMTLIGFKDLLKIRGLTDVKIDTEAMDTHPFRDIRDFRMKDELASALQILKKPHNPGNLKKQEKKDYPKGKSQRTVFGKANVITRTEKKIMSEPKKP